MEWSIFSNSKQTYLQSGQETPRNYTEEVDKASLGLYDGALLSRTGNAAMSSKSLLEQPQRKTSIVASPAFTPSFSASSFTVLIIFFLMSCNLGRERSCHKLPGKAWSDQAAPYAKQTLVQMFFEALMLTSHCLHACCMPSWQEGLLRGIVVRTWENVNLLGMDHHHMFLSHGPSQPLRCKPM